MQNTSLDEAVDRGPIDAAEKIDALQRAGRFSETGCPRDDHTSLRRPRHVCRRVRRRLDVHHMIKRPSGSDFDLGRLVALCHWCHDDQTDAPYERGGSW